MSSGPPVEHVVHAKVRLALHHLRAASGPQLLLLHGLGQRSPDRVPPDVEAWTGSIRALDFTGHGGSTVPSGGGYHPELLMGDVDAAIAHLGPVTLMGRGLGAYAALLTAGARPAEVRGAILADGPGLAGGGSGPGSPAIAFADLDGPTPPDPLALAELSRDVRPPDYATSFARQATHLSDLDAPIAVAAVVRPEWLTAIVNVPGVIEATVVEALQLYGRQA